MPAPLPHTLGSRWYGMDLRYTVLDPNRQHFEFLSKLILFYGYKQSLSKKALTSSVFELEKCSLFLNRSEFRQNLVGNIIRVLVRNLRAQSEIGNHERDQRVSALSEPSVPPSVSNPPFCYQIFMLWKSKLVYSISKWWFDPPCPLSVPPSLYSPMCFESDFDAVKIKVR